MKETPVIEDRSREELFEELLERADVYTDDWDPHTPDTGRTLLRVFSAFEADLRNRLHGTFDKHRMAFLDTLDFDQRPPKAARVPLRFHVSADIDRNVPVPGGTQVIAGTGESSKLFETPQDGGFEATKASLTDLVAVDPADDVIVDHSDVLESDRSTELFVGDSIQEHHLYLGNEDALNLQAGSHISVRADCSFDPEMFAESVVWEYYGEEESEGWHRLQPADSGEERKGDRSIEAFRRELQSHSETNGDSGVDSSTSDSTFEETFRLEGESLEHTVNGVQSRWLRCRLAKDEKPELFTDSIRKLTIHAGKASQSTDPDLLLSNDVPLTPEEGDIRPLGQHPQPPMSFYVGCEEAFTKTGGSITLTFASPSTEEDEKSSSTASQEEVRGPGVTGGPPRLSWEYWNGHGWSRLDSVEDGTDTLREAGTVSFTVPADIEATTVSGHESVWVRARLVGGNYGTPSIDLPDTDLETPASDLDPPVFGDVSVEYDHGERPFETVLRYNNASYSEDLSDRNDPFTPFVELPENEQTLYFGFDDTLRNGPIPLFIPLEDTTYPPSFDPGMEWESCEGPAESTWEELDVHDRTGGLTERGIVTLTLPEETVSFERFGRDRHWIRIRATQDEFSRERSDSRSTTHDSESVKADRAGRTTSPPVLENVYPNTQWAYNNRTVEDEILGSSDGSHNQSFACAHAPMMDIEVWVDESETLSTSEMRSLVEERSQHVEREYDERGELTAFWFRWTEVEDFLNSGPSDRQYVANRTLGTVEFGDGGAGMIPPADQDNVKATYTTGGGKDGNIDVGSITGMKSSISLVDDVSNPRSGDGGADVESREALNSRATSQLKHRERAVTVSDYEQVALAEFRQLAKVACIPKYRNSGTYITVIIVPETERAKPVPPMDLKYQVSGVLEERAPATITESDGKDIVVRGTEYAEISLELTIGSENVKSASMLKQTIQHELSDFLHPLSGKEGDGWAFGETPDPESIFELVENVDSVTEVIESAIYVEKNEKRQPLTQRTAESLVPEDTLVCNGDHEISVTMQEGL